MIAPLSSFEIEALTLSLRVASAALLGVLVPAAALGWVLARKRFAGKWLVEAMINLPLVLPPVVVGLVLLTVFGARGPIGRALEAMFGVTLAFHWTGAAVAAAVMALPLVVRPLRLAFEAIDPHLEQAAATLGAPPWQVFVRVSLPLAMPGLVSGALLGFARAFGEFGATITFAGAISGETQTLPVAIYIALQRAGGEGAAFRLAILSIVISVVALFVTEAINRRLLERRR